MRLIIASNNAHKIKEFKAILSPYFAQILSMQEAGIVLDVEEDGATFEENAQKKAQEIQQLLPNDAILADDSGLAVEALNGAPGVFSARYAGNGHNDEHNNQKLIKEMKNKTNRKAKFICALAFFRPNCEAISVRGICEGEIQYELMGVNGFGYDPLFQVDGFNKTFGQLSAEEKDQVSHRARAIRALRDELEKETEK